ncbi:MAG: hypothetical protein V3S04_05225 [Candidatus Omnitrophota bacterium]
MKVMDAIKRGFDIANANMKLILIIFIFNVIWNLGVIPFTPEALGMTGAGVAVSPMLTIISLLFVLASIFIQGGVLGSVKDIIKENKLDLEKFKGYGAKFYIRLLCLALIIMLIIAVVAFIATLVVAASAPTKNAVMITLTTIIALVVGGAGIYLVVLLFLAPYILVIEDVGIFESMARSIAFVRKKILKVIGLAAMLVLIGFGIGLVMGIIAGIISLAIKGKFLQFITGILNGGVNAYLSILVTGCLASYYLAHKDAGSKEEAPAA